MVADIAARADWPAYRSEAERLGFHAVAGVPLGLASERFGALNLYDHGPREWTPEDIGLARILADVAAGYLVQARLEDSRRLAEQLQYALDTRVVIEQAKGVLSVELGVSVDEAFDRLRRYARNHNQNLRALAQSVVAQGYRLEEPTDDADPHGDPVPSPV